MRKVLARRGREGAGWTVGPGVPGGEFLEGRRKGQNGSLVPDLV